MQKFIKCTTNSHTSAALDGVVLYSWVGRSRTYMQTYVSGQSYTNMIVPPTPPYMQKFTGIALQELRNKFPGCCIVLYCIVLYCLVGRNGWNKHTWVEQEWIYQRYNSMIVPYLHAAEAYMKCTKYYHTSAVLVLVVVVLF